MHGRGMLAQQFALLRKFEQMPIAQAASAGHEGQRGAERDARLLADEVLAEKKPPVLGEAHVSERSCRCLKVAAPLAVGAEARDRVREGIEGPKAAVGAEFQTLNDVRRVFEHDRTAQFELGVVVQDPAETTMIIFGIVE